MIASPESKEDILDRLVITRRKAQDLQARFTLKGKEAEAKKMKRKARELTTQIDRLLGDMVRAWTGTAATITESIKGNNTRLQTSIKNLKEDLENAEKLTKVIGVIDEVVSIAKAL